MHAQVLQTQKHVKAKLCLVGETGVGKTSLVRRFVTDTFDDKYIPTVGTKITKKSMDVIWRGREAVLDMTVWDIMGEHGFRQLLKEAYFQGTQGLIAVCDLTRQDTLFDLTNWINLSIKQAGDVPICFIGNKLDRRQDISVEEDELSRLASIHKAPYYLASAKTGENVESAFRSLSHAVAEKYQGDE